MTSHGPCQPSQPLRLNCSTPRSRAPLFREKASIADRRRPACPAAGLLRQRLLTAASTCATDPNSRVSLKWLQFLQETATANASDIDEELPGLIAACVEALGSSSSACRQTAVQVPSPSSLPHPPSHARRRAPPRQDAATQGGGLR